jgi:phenylacetate-coenzyme A ligase PaaK-like adenylate-forming protein
LNTFDVRVRELVAHAYENAPAIKNQLNATGLTPDDIQYADDLAKIPVLSKDALVEIHQENPPFGGFLTIDPADLPRIYISPGPIFDPQPPPEDPELGLAAFKYVGFGYGDRVLNTFMYHLTPAGLLLDEGLRACGATVIPTGPGNTDLQIQMAMALNVTGFVGQPSYLMTILDKIEEQGIGPDDFPIKKALFSAEIYTPSQQERFEGEWGMKTTSAYGTADLGFIGYSRHDIQGFVITSNVLMQICDSETGELVPAGEIGEIVVTIFNKAYPLIRFGTGDLGSLDAEMIDGNQHLLGLFGRSGGAIKVRGMFLHPNQLKAAISAFPQIEQIQAIITRQDNKDVVTILIQLKRGASEFGLADMLKELAQNAVRLRIDDVVFVDEIDTSERTIVDERNWD